MANATPPDRQLCDFRPPSTWEEMERLGLNPETGTAFDDWRRVHAYSLTVEDGLMTLTCPSCCPRESFSHTFGVDAGMADVFDQIEVHQRGHMREVFDR